MSTREILLEEIKRQPEPVLIEVWHYLRFLTRQREEEAWADVLPSRQVEQEVLDHLDSKMTPRHREICPVDMGMAAKTLPNRCSHRQPAAELNAVETAFAKAYAW